jgi:rod shape-determining protein MreC
MRRYLLLILLISLLALTYFTSFFIKKERSFDENLRLKQENESLKAQIQQLTTNNQPLTTNNNYLVAKVFSTYPFNIKNQITINVGAKQGVKKMMAVTVEGNLLLGYISKVFDDYSIVQTIFDPSWQLPVRIGKEEIDGLFQGGSEPKLVLIAKEKAIQVGDVAYSASQEFPYGLKIGEILEIRENAAGVFKEAVLKIPFNVNELREVMVIKSLNH